MKTITSFVVLIALSFIGANIARADTECGVDAPTGKKVDGSSLWTAVQAENSHAHTPCDIAQFSWNNFLYLASEDGAGHPKFMSLAPWYQAFPAAGSPKWLGSYQPLSSTRLNRTDNQGQAGDGFHLLDVAGRTTAFDMRVNQTYLEYVKENNYYTKAGLTAAAAEFSKNPGTDGIWFPPNGTDKGSSLEIKSAWRDFGGAGECPGNIMHCEKDTSGNEWGLVGFHLVQKTEIHGEFIWATFEHAANAPDCSAGGGNPIKQNAVNPQSKLAPINANINIKSLAGKTGWNYFDYANYKANGGDGKTCQYPTNGSPTGSLCMLNPNPSGDKETWRQVNVCRTDQLPIPSSSACADTMNMSSQAACLNRNVVNSFPKALDNKWKYYQFMGAQFTFWGASGPGAPNRGCWEFSGNKKIQCPKPVSSEFTVSQEGSLNLANTTLETWMQKGVHLSYGNNQSVGETDCFTCHQPKTQSWGEGDMSHMFLRIVQSGSAESVVDSKE